MKQGRELLSSKTTVTIFASTLYNSQQQNKCMNNAD